MGHKETEMLNSRLFSKDARLDLCACCCCIAQQSLLTSQECCAPIPTSHRILGAPSVVTSPAEAVNKSSQSGFEIGYVSSHCKCTSHINLRSTRTDEKRIINPSKFSHNLEDSQRNENNLKKTNYVPCEMKFDSKCKSVDAECSSVNLRSATNLGGVPGLNASIHKIQNFDCRDSPRWSEQSLNSITSLKIDLPRVQNHSHGSFGSTSPAAYCSFKSCLDKNQTPPNLPRISALHRKSLSASKSYAGPTNSSNPVGDLPARKNLRRKTVDTYGPRSLPTIPRPPIATPTNDTRHSLKDETFSVEESQSFDETTRLAARNHPQRHSIAFFYSNTSASNISYHVDTSLDLSSSFHELEDDYSYAYDSNISPAALIRMNASNDQYHEGEAEKRITENIYEEIDKKKSAEREVSDDSLISVNSDSGIGASGCAKPPNKLSTLDFNQKRSHRAKRGLQRFDSDLESSIDALIARTAPDISDEQRRALRKNLVDEIFEELIQRHHGRVLRQLNLDVEEFIAPSPSPVPNKEEEECRSTGSSSSKTKPRPFGSPLQKCKSVDLKDIPAASNSLTSKTCCCEKSERVQRPSMIGSIRKMSKVLHRKLFSPPSAQKMSFPEDGFHHQEQSLVSRRGRRPLSAVVTKMTPRDVTGSSLSDDDDSEEETERRLQRSKIIESFLKEDINSNIPTQTETETLK